MGSQVRERWRLDGSQLPFTARLETKLVFEMRCCSQISDGFECLLQTSNFILPTQFLLHESFCCSNPDFSYN